MARSYTVSSTGIYLKALLYGEPGSGKTSLAASAQDHPKMADALVLNVEGGLLSVAHRGNIRAVDIASTVEVEEIFWQIVKDKDVSRRKDGEFSSVNTVILDNATEFQAINLQEIVNEAIANGRPEKKGARDDIWQDDYGVSTIQLKRIFRWFRQLPVNFIVTAHAKKVFPKGPRGQVNPNAEPDAVLPSLTAKLSESLMGYVDFVWYLWFDSGEGGEGEKREPTYNLLTRSEGIYFAKTRGPRFKEALGPTRVIPESGGLGEIYELYLQTSDPNYVLQPRKKKKVANA